ncbi:hypothetical protein QVD17_26771 [Tagetes erecta]|uniref:FAS1 domain-containing protein n=1 Tax=Tagetes erecta TaxID=13708 RepID=A0AAD8KAP7_TARER|nr:hypothetical protein QVD17_26771 [Tagetes erecta]
MASTFILTVVLLLITVINTVVVTAVSESEYSSLLSALRNRGYHVFANAITTTDLHYDVITGGNFTFFAPIDSVLYTLDMSMSAADYTTTLRYHVVPHRLRLSDLRQLPYGLSSFPTLLRDHRIHIVNPLSLPLPITIEGVYISVPDLYSDAHIVVHGLESVIDFRSVNDTINSSLLGEDFTRDNSPVDIHLEADASFPQVEVPVAGIETVASPLPEIKSDSIIQQHLSPAIKSESIIQPHKSPEIKSKSIIQSHKLPVTKSESITQSHQPKIYFETTTQPLEKHASIATRSRLTAHKIHHVSLATKSIGNVAGDFGQVDDTIIHYPIADDEGEQLKIANIRRGDPYMRELYTPNKMTCAHE